MAKKSAQDIKAEAAELSKLIGSMRKKDHNFGLSIGKDGGIVLAADPKKSASVMWRQAKGNGGTSKGCMGVASVKGKVIQFRPEDGEEPPKALYMNAKKHLKELGLAFKIAFVLADGVVVGDEDDGDDDDANEAKTETSTPEDVTPVTPQETEEQELQAASPKTDAGAPPPMAAAAPSEPEGAPKPAVQEAPPENPEEKRKELEAAFEPTAQNLQRLSEEAGGKVAQKAEQMASMFWQVLDTEDWKKAANISNAAKTFADKEIALLAAFPAPSDEPVDEQAREAALLKLDASNPKDAEKLMKEDLTVREPSDIFDPDHMIELSKKEFEYAGSATLRELMPKIEAGLKPDERDTVITQLAEIVGANKDKLDADYDRFRILLEQQKAFGKKKNSGHVPGLEDENFPEFRASQEQLLFGAILGEVFDIHEVFAALLSPTGGLVGPGNHLIEVGKKDRDPNAPDNKQDEFYIETDAAHLTDRHPVGLHGIFHDAAGYLKSYHDDGPGYNYLESDDEFLKTDNPLCGQVSGIEFWVKQIQEEDAQAADEFAQAVAKRADEQVLKMEKQLESARDQTADAIDDKLAEYEALKKKAGEWTGWLPSGSTDQVELMADAAVYGAAGAAELAVDATTRVVEAGAHVAAAGDKIEAELDEYGTELKGTAKDLGFAALGGAIDAGEAVVGSAKDALGALADGADGIGAAVSEAGSDIGNIAADAGDELLDTVARTSQQLDDADGIIETAGALAGAASEMTGTVTKAALKSGAEALEAAVDVGANVLDTSLDLAKESLEATVGLGKAAGKTAGKVIDIGVDAAGDAFDAVVDIGDAVGGALGGVADAAGGLVDDLVDNPLTEAVADKLSGWASSFGW